LLTLEELVFFHTVAIDEFGGATGIRDRGALESALARPAARFGSQRVYKTPFQRAAALMEALIQNHGFVDGNKRTAIMAAAYWLEREGFRLDANQDELVRVVIDIATHKVDLETLASWLERNSQSTT